MHIGRVIVAFDLLYGTEAFHAEHQEILFKF